jgi:hypothetical protein
MLLKRIFFFAVIGVSLAAVQPSAAPQPSSVAARLVGAWRLVSFQSFDQNGTARPGAYDTGILVYDASGRMSAHLMHSSNKADQPLTTDADRAAAYRRYLGYWGPFTVDEVKGVVTHHVEGSSNPNWVGSNQIRYYDLSSNGERLTLSLKSGDRVTSTLLWDRIRASH